MARALLKYFVSILAIGLNTAAAVPMHNQRHAQPAQDYRYPHYSEPLPPPQISCCPPPTPPTCPQSKPYPIPIPIPIVQPPQIIRIPVDRPVSIPKPVPYPVDRPFPVDRPIPVSRPYAVPIPVPMPKAIPFPVPIFSSESKHHHGHYDLPDSAYTLEKDQSTSYENPSSYRTGQTGEDHYDAADDNSSNDEFDNVVNDGTDDEYETPAADHYLEESPKDLQFSGHEGKQRPGSTYSDMSTNYAYPLESPAGEKINPVHFASASPARKIKHVNGGK